MKENVGKKGIKKRLLSLILTLAMVLALMPMGSINVKAAVNEYKQFFDLLVSSSPATIEGLVEVSEPDTDGYRTFKLLKDITADSEDIKGYNITAGSSGSPRKIILDLNGKTINRNLTSESGASYNGYAFLISDYNNMIIDDSSATGIPGEGNYVSGTITGGACSGIFLVGENSTLTLRNGKIAGNYTYSSGGGIDADSGTLIMEGGEVCNNISDDTKYGMYGGGGIYTNATFNMTGGAIYGNKANATGQRGGGIFVFGSKTYSITGGKIFNNECNCNSYGTSGAGIFTNNNQVGSEIGGSVQIYDNKNTAKPDLASSFYAYNAPENIKIVPLTSEARMGYSAYTGFSNPAQIAKEITTADLSHISSEYTTSESMVIFYCGGESVHLSLAGENLGSITNHTTHTSGTLWAYKHSHSFAYGKEGDAITSYCKNVACPCGTSESNKAIFTLSVESKPYSATEVYAGAKVLDADGIEIKSDNVNKWTSAGLSVPSIKILKTNTEGATYGGSVVSDLKGLEEGNYYAYVLFGGNTLTKAFKILAPHSWEYTEGTGDNANKLTATCNAAGHTCDPVTLTLIASNANYSGNPVTASMDTSAWEEAGLTPPTIEYYKGTAKLASAPKEVGSYTAKITVEGKTASIDFEIKCPSHIWDSGVVTKEPTCTEKGVKTFTCTTCKTTKTSDIAKKGHEYAKPKFTWKGYSSCEAIFTCSNDKTHTNTVTCTIKSKITKQPTAKAKGEKTYTATAIFDGKTYTNKKTEVLPKLVVDEKATNQLNSGLKTHENGKKILVSWGKVSNADGYLIYAAYCGKNKPVVVKTVNSASIAKTEITKLKGKAIDTKKQVKLYVVAYQNVNGKKIQIAKSITAHIVGSADKNYTDAKKIIIKKASYTIKKGKTAIIKATTVKNNKKLKILTHVKEFRYATTNSKVATVDKNGKIKAIGKGKCTIYVYAVNGYAKNVKVTVK